MAPDENARDRPRRDAEPERGGPLADALAQARGQLDGLLDAVTAIGSHLELDTVLRRIVTTAMELVDARYGALGILDEDGRLLAQFIPMGLTDAEKKALDGVPLPHGRGLLGRLIRSPEPLRVDDIAAHPDAAGFPRGHPPMKTLLGVAIRVRGRVYGDLYLADRHDGRPFDDQDEALVTALAGAAGVAIDNARLVDRIRSDAERFQRLLLPTLPDLAPFDAAAVYQPATAPGHIGGDWYDAVLLPDHACATVIGDVVGHDLHAAAAMAQIRSMLRALLYDLRTPPSAVLTQLDRTIHAITDLPPATVCLARIEPAGSPWTLHWSNAGHPPPLVLARGGARYLDADPGLPLGVDPDQPRPDHTFPLPADATVLFFTDGLVEHPAHGLDNRLDALAALATAHADEPLGDLCRTLTAHHPGDGHDDIALLAVRTPS
ncbi:hypothetical protein GCM10023205_25730 [Yinghuangia aomiensis]|uniref:Serine phosphatase RsbU, regulator of sigma subunit n=1 Tax=Yinghuangia aomiensis TaxID=676205 RepID=A0ABP9H460_9ACTN